MSHSQYDIIPLRSRDEWDAILRIVQPRTFLHSWEWGIFQEHMGAKIFRLGIYVGDILVGIALIIKVTARRGSFLFCPQGPIITDSGFSFAGNYELLSTLVAYLRALALKEKCHFIRISPLMENTKQNRQLFYDCGFHRAPIHMHPEIAWMLDITKSEEELLGNMRKGTRYSIRKAQKDGVVITQSSDPADTENFYRIYRSTVDRQHFSPFSKDYMNREFESFQGSDAVRYFFALYRGEILATAMIIFDHSSAYYHHGASLLKYPKVPLSYLLQWEAIREAKQRGCCRYNFWGIAEGETVRFLKFFKREHPWAGLSLFKKGFGGVEERYVSAQDFPLHPWYNVVSAIETIRRFRRGL